MYQPGQVSTLLGIPTSTLRRYSVLVADYLSPGAHKRKRVYNDQDLTILSRVRDLAAQNVPLAEIPLQLAATIDQPGEPGEAPSNALALPGVLEKIAEFRSLFDQQAEQIQKLSDDLTDTKAQLNDLREWLETPWYKRIGRRRPGQ